MKRLAQFAFGSMLCLLLPAARQAAAAEEGFRAIFDGKTLAGWDGDPRFWSVQDGAITGETTKENPAPAQHVPHLARRPARRFRTQGRVPHAQSGLRQLGHPDPQLGRPAQVAGQRLPARHGFRRPIHGHLLRREFPRRPGPTRPEDGDRRRPQAQGRRTVRRQRRTGQVHQETAIGTSTTSSPAGTTSSRRSTGT